MKKTLRIVGFTLGLAVTTALHALADQPAPVPAAPPTPGAAAGNTSGPRIKFDYENFDYGKAPAGQPLNHTFVFTNVGNQTLEVTKVTGTCGCTVAGTWTRKVEPGETGTIPITINVNAMWNGQMTKVVTVECNDKTRITPTTPNIPVTVKFTVWKPIEVSQPYVFLNIPGESTNEVSTVVRVDNNTEQPLDLYDAQSMNPSLAVQIKTNEAGKHFELTVRALPPFRQGNNVSGQITAKSSSTNMPVVAIQATVNVQPVISINPPQVLLEAPPLSAVAQKSVTIQYLGSGSLRLSNAVFSAKGVDVQVNEAQPGKNFSVVLSFPPGFESQGKAMELTVNSSSAQMPVIKVPVTQLPRPIKPFVPVKPSAGVSPKPPEAARVNGH